MQTGHYTKNNMKILLIGKNGQLGQEIHRQSKERGYEIYAFSREELDVTNSEKVKSKIEHLKPTVVINATAFHVVPDCEIYPDRAFLVNAVAIRNIAEITEKMNIRFITYSTDYVFDGKKGKPYVENDLPSPVQTYGVSKVAGEYLALAYNTKSIVIRSSGVYGGKAGSRAKKGNFALSILKEAAGKNKIEVASEQIVNPTYAVDLAKASLDLLTHKDASGIYHLANKGYCSWAQFASEILKLIGSKTKIIPVDRKGMAGSLKRPLFSALENTRGAKLGVKLPSWQDGLKRYISTFN